MIIDAHAHMDEIVGLGWIDPPEKVVGLMDEVGIDMAVVSTYANYPGIKEDAIEYLYEGSAKYPGRFLPYVRLDPWYGERALDGMDLAIKKYGFKGVKFHPVHYTLHPFGAETVAILKRAAEYDVPVLFHCSDEMMCLPLQIEEAAKQSPETTVILAHSGGFFHMEDAIRIVARNKNMYMDTCENASIAGLKKAVRTVGAEKVLFGTDIPTDNPRFEIEKIKALGLSQEEEDLIFYKNIARLLHLDV